MLLIRPGNLHASPLDRRQTLLASSNGGTAGSCTLILQETEGPYPLLAVLSNSTMVGQGVTEGENRVSR